MAETRNRVVETITYPLVLVAAAFALAMFMMLKVVPVFNDVLMHNFMEYPRPAAGIFRAWVALSGFAGDHAPAMLLLFILVFSAIVCPAPEGGSGSSGPMPSACICRSLDG
jgi:type II secretory pathway component PulF